MGQYASYAQNQMYNYEDTEATYKSGVYGGAAPGFAGFGQTPVSVSSLIILKGSCGLCRKKLDMQILIITSL